MMQSSRSRRIRRVSIGAAFALLAAAPIACLGDTVASLLGNFTINQYCGLRLADDTVEVRYVVVFGQLPALRELHAADVDGNGDGVTSQQEREAYARRLVPQIAQALQLTVDGVPLALHASHSATSLPAEQGGFSLRVDVDFSAALAASVASGVHTLAFTNRNYAGQPGWREIAVQADAPVKVYATDGYSTSLTGGLTDALAQLPAEGPPDERAVHLSFTLDEVPQGARMLQPRPGTGAGAKPLAVSASVGQPPEAPPSAGAASPWLERETRRVIALIAAPDVAPRIALLAVLAAALLGAVHAFSPGHGKTVVGAYLIGSRATPRHALFLGFAVTITHTMIVFGLGFGTLFASRYIVPQQLLPVLSLLSGMLVLGMGLVLLAQRWRAVRSGFASHAEDHARYHAQYRDRAAHPHHDAGDAGAATRMPSHAAAIHSHGGRPHSHWTSGAAGAPVTWRNLLALGISGGLVPCPSALVLLLAAIAVNKTAYGLLLVLAFSAGLALTLTAVGLAFLYARNRIGRPLNGARWPTVLPLLSAGVITLVGALLCYGTLAGRSL